MKMTQNQGVLEQSWNGIVSRIIKLETGKLIMWWDGNEYPCGHYKMEVSIWELDKN